MNKFSLKRSVTGLEDSIITIAGPALAISGIIAGVDLVTGGHLLTQVGWLTLAWAITLLLTLDFQVLALGVRGMRVYQSNKSTVRKVVEVGLILAIATAISFVSIQMQSVIARVNAESISIDAAALQLGVNLVALTWERSTLVLVLIFLSGWLREAPTGSQGTIPAPQAGSQPRVRLHIEEEAVVNAPARDELPEHAASLSGSRIASKEGEIARALAGNPNLTAEEISVLVKCTPRTAEKWASKIRSKAS
jgi:hypothetical protein